MVIDKDTQMALELLKLDAEWDEHVSVPTITMAQIDKVVDELILGRMQAKKRQRETLAALRTKLILDSELKKVIAHIVTWARRAGFVVLT